MKPNRHKFKVGGEKKSCKTCGKLFAECQNWVSL